MVHFVGEKKLKAGRESKTETKKITLWNPSLWQLSLSHFGRRRIAGRTSEGRVKDKWFMMNPLTKLIFQHSTCQHFSLAYALKNVHDNHFSIVNILALPGLLFISLWIRPQTFRRLSHSRSPFFFSSIYFPGWENETKTIRPWFTNSNKLAF